MRIQVSPRVSDRGIHFDFVNKGSAIAKGTYAADLDVMVEKTAALPPFDPDLSNVRYDIGTSADFTLVEDAEAGETLFSLRAPEDYSIEKHYFGLGPYVQQYDTAILSLSLEGGAKHDIELNDIGVGTSLEDTLRGNAEEDYIIAQAGDDRIWAGPEDTGDDTLDGGSGDDAIGGGLGDDLLIGGAGRDSLYGVGGDDSLDGGADSDVIWAGQGSDEITAGTGQDTIGTAGGRDNVHGNDGSDWIAAGSGDDSVFGGNGTDTIFSGAGRDQLHGGKEADLLFNGAGSDTVYGDDGNDTIWGGAGNDILTGGNDADVFAFVPGEGRDVVADFNVAEGDSLNCTALGISSPEDADEFIRDFEASGTMSASQDGYYANLSFDDLTVSVWLGEFGVWPAQQEPSAEWFSFGEL